MYIFTIVSSKVAVTKCRHLWHARHSVSCLCYLFRLSNSNATLFSRVRKLCQKDRLPYSVYLFFENVLFFLTLLAILKTLWFDLRVWEKAVPQDGRTVEDGALHRCCLCDRCEVKKEKIALYMLLRACKCSLQCLFAKRMVLFWNGARTKWRIFIINQSTWETHSQWPVWRKSTYTIK